MNSVVIFEVPQHQIQTLRNQLKGIGYYDSWLGNQIQYFLPNNAMWKPNCELKQAKSDVERLSTANNIPLLRCIALSVNPWEGITGSPVVSQGLPPVG
jgi:hypothetical protein